MEYSRLFMADCTTATKTFVQVKSVTQYYKYSAELPSISEIQRLVAGYPDEDMLIEIIARSYDYIQKLPLAGTPKYYGQDDTSLAEL